MIMTVYAHNVVPSQRYQHLLLINQDKLITDGDPIGVSRRKLAIGINLISASFIIWVDNIARSDLSNKDIPIITSALGRLFFLLIMIHTRNTH